MRSAPPHIVLTNYAMLEYLLLRPVDMELFAGDTWSFVALDEAHVYAGAKGAEIAMLLRRLRDRVASTRPLQFIATSASLTGSRADVMSFATKLFDAPFEWEDDDPSRQDQVLAASRRSPSGRDPSPPAVSPIRACDAPQRKFAGSSRSHAACTVPMIQRGSSAS